MARPELAVTATGASAIADVVARVPREGAIVRLPAGRFPLDAPLVLATSTTLAGAGPGRTVLVPSASLACAIEAHDVRHLSIRGLTIEWASSGTSSADAATPGDAAIALAGIERLTLVDLEVIEAPGAALSVRRAAHVRATDVTARSSAATAIEVVDATDVELHGIEVHGAGRARLATGLHLDGVRGGAVDATVRGATGTGILIDATSAPTTDVVVRATVAGALRGIVAVAAAPHPVRHLTLTGSCTGIGHVGVRLTNVDQVTAVDLEVEGTGEHGILLDGRTGSRRCTIAGAEVRGFAVAIAEVDGSTDNRIVTRPPRSERARRDPAPGTPASPAPISSGRRGSLVGRARRSAATVARRADRAVRRAGRAAPPSLRRPVAKARSSARAAWRSRGGR